MLSRSRQIAFIDSVPHKKNSISDKALLATSKTAELIIKKKKAHNIGQELILPTCK
jgi:hypothetical protein